MQNKSDSVRRVFAFILALGAVLAVPGEVLGQAAGDRVPGDRWMRYADVEQAGFDAAKLAAAQRTWEGLASSAFETARDRPTSA